MLNYKNRYPNNTPTVRTAYPYGEARDDTYTGAKNGFPHQADWINDVLGLLQYMAVKGRVTPNGTPDNALSSQMAQSFFSTYRIGGYKAFDPNVVEGSSPDTMGYSTLEHNQVTNYEAPGGTIRKHSKLVDGGILFGGSPSPGDENVGFRREVYDFTGDLIWSVGTEDIAGRARQVYSYDAGSASTDIVFTGIPVDANIHAISFIQLMEGPPGTRLRSLAIPLSFTIDYTDISGWQVLNSAFAIAAAYDGGSVDARFYVDWDPSSATS